MVDLGHGGDRALATAAAGALLYRHRRRDAEDGVDIGARRGLHKLPRIGVERLKVAALAFGEQDVEGECRLARARYACHHGELVARNVDINVLQVVLARIVYAYRFTLLQQPLLQWNPAGKARQACLSSRCLVQRLGVFAQGPAGVGAWMGGHLRRCAGADHRTAGLPAFGTQINNPVRGADHVQVVFYHHQRVPGGDQPAEGAQQLGDVLEVQARGRLVEQEQLALARHRAR